MMRVVTTLLLLVTACAEEFDPDTTRRVLERTTKGVLILEVSPQVDEFFGSDLFDAVVEAEGHTLYLSGLDPRIRSAKGQRLVLMSIDDLHPLCAREVEQDTVGGLNLKGDPRVAGVEIEELSDLATETERLYVKLAKLPRTRSEAVQFEFPDGSIRRCWIHRKG